MRHILLILFLVSGNLLFGNQTENTTRRFGIFIGANNGGRERVTLRYAVTDASSIKNVFSEMGGISGTDSIMLVEPTVREINRSIDTLHENVLRARGTNRRTEIVFYYSGHSDEEGLLLNREKYPYRELRERINSIPSDMRIVILDSCASGAFTRLKGGEKTLPFLMDSSFTAEGYAFLTSSSANEASQESDRIAASYFTHSLVAGLRGAADSVGDGRVTLNELYRFAYAETIARTETSLYGTQHPSYDIQISGTGDLVLTDISQTSAGIVFDEHLTGRISIRNSRDQLVLELTKTVRPLELGLEPGLYRITLQQGSELLRAEVVLAEGRRTMVTRENFVTINTERTRRRGDDDAFFGKRSIYTFFFNLVYEPFPIPLIGFVNVGIGNLMIFQAAFINWNSENFNGFQAGFVNTAGGNFNGLQTGFINTVAGNFNGFQAAFINTTAGNFNGVQTGFINTNAGETNGVQLSFINTAAKEMKGPQIGFVNVAAKKISGFQIGFLNYADSIEGIPIGFLSIVRKGGYQAIEYSFTEFHTYNVGLKIGVDKFYTNVIAAYNQTKEFSLDNFAYGLGFGSIFPVIGRFLFINPEFNIYSTITWDTTNINLNSFIVYLGVNLGKLSIVAGPSVTWLYSGSADDINEFTKKYDADVSSLLPPPNFSLYTFDINEYNRIVVGARIAARLRF